MENSRKTVKGSKPFSSTKFYVHGEEANWIKKQTMPIDKNMIRYCESPIFETFPGCVEAFTTYKLETVYGTVKHEPEQRLYERPKFETVVTCREMPIDWCQRLIDADSMVCPSCKRKVVMKMPKGSAGTCKGGKKATKKGK